MSLEQSTQPLTQPESTQPHSEQSQGNFFLELIKFAILAICIVVPIRFFVAQPFIVSGTSMFPTFNTGDYLIVDELSYRFKEPQRGEVIIFKYPNNPSEYFIKRIIGLPGETIDIKGETVTIFNKEHPQGEVLSEPYIKSDRNSDVHLTLTPDEYFVMGDNRFASSDSRIWGPLKRHFIVGKAFLRLFPFKEIGIDPGQATIQSK